MDGILVKQITDLVKEFNEIHKRIEELNNKFNILEALLIRPEVEEKVKVEDEKNKTRYIIFKNSAKCKKCGDIIESKHVHDYVNCKCGSIAVDGGKEYLRRMWKDGDPEDYIEELSEGKEVPIEDIVIKKVVPPADMLAELFKEEAEEFKKKFKK